MRSDTVTRPTPGMRRAMAEAEVGDDMSGEDPTVNRLEQITDKLVTDPAIPAADRSQLVSELQDMLEQILVDYLDTLLHVPTETIEPASEVVPS